MRKVMSILAVAVFTLGLFSCETETADQSLYEQACDTCHNERDDRGSGDN
ncbi:hypothetical protein GGR42_000048 [Saonia flava]|uniref:Uncharacterized protein n=1 Tax=Saonia flava TaxID=523696 RepID=A0A846QKW2_9FLAO|nr:hypothetical protein [Saonia flava]